MTPEERAEQALAWCSRGADMVRGAGQAPTHDGEGPCLACVATAIRDAEREVREGVARRMRKLAEEWEDYASASVFADVVRELRDLADEIASTIEHSDE